MIYDYHTHTCFSEDSEAPVDEMIRGAIDKGIAQLAITDHYDPDYPDPEYEFVPDFPSYHRMLIDKQEEYADRIRIVKGIEIGLQEGSTLDKCREEAAAFPYDFIIGSWGGAANEAIALLSIIVSIFRFGWSNLAESPADFSKKDAERAEVSASVQEKKAA